MSFLRTCQSVLIFSIICIFSHLAEAEDISTLQTALTLALEDMEKAKGKHEANAQAVTQQQQVVAERKKQLADESSQLTKMQKDADLAWEQYLEARKKHEKAQSALNAAWGKK